MVVAVANKYPLCSLPGIVIFTCYARRMQRRLSGGGSGNGALCNVQRCKYYRDIYLTLIYVRLYRNNDIIGVAADVPCK